MVREWGVGLVQVSGREWVQVWDREWAGRMECLLVGCSDKS